MAQAKFLKKEQDILFKAVEAYTGLTLAKEKFDINQSNVNLSERQVETDRSRLERGQVTLADVAQSESSLAESQAKLIESQNGVLTSKLEYERVVGPLNSIDNLNGNYGLSFEVPSSLNQAIDRIINIEVDKNVLITRLVERAKKSGRAADTKEVIVNRQNVYLELTAPLIEFYKSNIIHIDGDGSIDKVTERILKRIP